MVIIEKNKTERIQIAGTEYGGHSLIDARVHYQNKETGEWLPTRKGISFKKELLQQVIKALEELREQD